MKRMMEASEVAAAPIFGGEKLQGKSEDREEVRKAFENAEVMREQMRACGSYKSIEEADEAFFSMPAFQFTLPIVKVMATLPDNTRVPSSEMNFLAHHCVEVPAFATIILRYYFTVHWDTIKARQAAEGGDVQELLDLKEQLLHLDARRENQVAGVEENFLDGEDDSTENEESIAFGLD